MQYNNNPKEYSIFFNEYDRITIHRNNLELYPSSLFYMIDKFENGNEHRVFGFRKNELLKVEYFYENHYWEFLPPKIFIDRTLLSMGDSLDYLGLLISEEDYYSLFEIEYEFLELEDDISEKTKFYDDYDDDYIENDGW